jgi:hypothetical protein
MNLYSRIPDSFSLQERGSPTSVITPFEHFAAARTNRFIERDDQYITGLCIQIWIIRQISVTRRSTQEIAICEGFISRFKLLHLR